MVMMSRKMFELFLLVSVEVIEVDGSAIHVVFFSWFC